jgi:transcriptional regulator with XRE-family HTH domain
MDISNLLTDGAVLEEIGHRISRLRINQPLTQAELANSAGVSKRTIERIESGHSAQLSSIIRVMRAWGILSGLEQVFPSLHSRPMDLLKRKGKVRQRASRSKKTSDSNDTGNWQWGDEP